MMGKFIHGRPTDKATKELIKRICEPHGIDPKWGPTITINDGYVPNYRIDYFNKDGQVCTLEVQGEIPTKERKDSNVDKV